jgi:hypothetical protein
METGWSVMGKKKAPGLPNRSQKPAWQSIEKA